MTEHLTSLMEGPPPRTPTRVTAGMVLRGRRVVVNESGVWVGDLRAADDPYWYDEAAPPGTARWAHGGTPPDGADAARARLFVAVVTEPDWYAWARTHRRPEVREVPAYLVFVE